MATALYIRGVEDPEESLKTAVSSHQLRHRVCSYRLLQVLVGLLAVSVLALTGGVIWMKLDQENKLVSVSNNKVSQERLWTVKISGNQTNFTSPRTQKYAIFGIIFTKTNATKCDNKFRLYYSSPSLNNYTIITTQSIPEMFAKDDVELMEGAGLFIELNCAVEIDEEKSKLFVYQQNL